MRCARIGRAARLGAAAGALVSAITAGCGPIAENAIYLFLQTQLDDPELVGVDPGPPTYSPREFVNWESPHVAPLALSSDGQRLVCVNTPDNSILLFDVSQPAPVQVSRIPVGLDPVSVRLRTTNEAWVANHMSDSISIVDLEQGLVRRTLHPGDEPTDIAFAGERAFVVCSQENRIWVYELDDLDAAPRAIDIAGEDPRQIQAASDGSRLFVTIFESGNGTTLVREPAVSSADSPYGGANPIPIENDAALADAAAHLPKPPPTGLIVQKDAASGAWLDENGADWSAQVDWDLHDHDLAVIDASSLDVSYVSGLMNLNMAFAQRPDGAITVVGTDAANVQRFEPTQTGRFVHSVLAEVDADSLSVRRILDLNPHLAAAYAAGLARVEPELRARSVADPRAIVWSGDGERGFIAGMGSNQVALFNRAGERVSEIAAGEGPTGLALDSDRSRLYVLNRFEASVAVFDSDTLAPLGRTAFFDPTPQEIRSGRPFLYNAVRTSGLGVTACGACHVDGRMDQLAWDLGDPTGQVVPFDQECTNVFALADVPFGEDAQPGCNDFHPMKGPLATQTLQGILGTEPLHWRGDRRNLAAFNPAFVSLNGNDAPLSAEELASFEGFIDSLTFPPNPNRRIDNSLKTDLNGDNPARGRELFMSMRIDQGDVHFLELPGAAGAAVQRVGPLRTCNSCHQAPAGTNQTVTSGKALTVPQSIKVPQLRNMHEKTGFTRGTLSNRGFGFAHDGKHATLADFLSITVFNFGDPAVAQQNRRDVVSFLLSFSTDTHAGVGQQVTVDAAHATDPLIQDRLALFLALADRREVGLVAHGRLEGARRGWTYHPGEGFVSGEPDGKWSAARLRAAQADDVLTWMLVPLGSEGRIGAGSP